MTSGADLVTERARELGVALAAWRGEAGLNQTELARQLHYDRTSITHTEAGRQVPALEFWQACEELLGAGGTLLRLYEGWQTAKRQHAEQAASRVRAERRKRLGRALDRHDDSVQAGSELILQNAGERRGESPPYDVRRSRIGAVDVAAIRRMLDALVTSDRQFGGGESHEYAATYLRRIIQPCLHAQADVPVRYRLLAVSAEFAMRVASMCMDAGDGRMSRRLLGTASGLAHESDDLTLSAWVLARRGEQEIQERNADRAIAFTSAAVAVARQAPPATRAFILTKQALAMSMTGDRPATEAVLGEVRDAHDRAGEIAEPAWMGLYGWGHLRHDEGRCYGNLNMGAAAAQAAEDSMRVRSRDRFARPHAFSLGVQAIGYAQAKEIEKACAVAQELVGLARQLASQRVRLRLAEVLDALAAYRDVAAVRDLYELTRPIAGTATDDRE